MSITLSSRNMKLFQHTALRKDLEAIDEGFYNLQLILYRSEFPELNYGDATVITVKKVDELYQLTSVQIGGHGKCTETKCIMTKEEVIAKLTSS